MADFESLTSEEILVAEAQTWSLMSMANAASLRCAVQLGIPDAIHKHGKPITVPQLLAALPIIKPSKAPYLHRLLRVLIHSGLLLLQEEQVFPLEHAQILRDPARVDSAGLLLLREKEKEVVQYYSLTPAGLLLQQKGRFKALKRCDPYDVKAWAALGDWFQNEEQSPFSTAHGETMWDFFSRQPALGDGFNESMAQDSKLIAKVLLDKCRHVFEGLITLVDVGGGTGIIAQVIAKSFPKLECTVFDRPQVVANLNGSDNLKFIGGDMFDKIPPANALLLKWILHDWKDEDCVKILKNCKKAIPGREEGGKVIIIDIVLDYQSEFVQAQILIDMAMMVKFGSKERNKNEWEKLFWEAGFSDYKIIHALGLRSLIELYP